MGIINNQSKASWNDFLLCRKSYGVCISFRKLSSECVMHIAQRHVLTVLLPDQKSCNRLEVAYCWQGKSGLSLCKQLLDKIIYY